jgi:hypothetical protein
MTEKLTKLEIVAIEIVDGLDRISIQHNRNPELKRLKKELVMKKIIEFKTNEERK